MKLKSLSKEEIETMSFDDLAYEILKEKGKKMKTADIFKTICDLLEMNDAAYEAQIADFFTLLATEKRFIQLDKGFWDLRENHTAKIEIEDFSEDEEEIEDTIDFEPISYDLNSSERTKQINAVKKHIKENGAVYSSIRSAVMSDEEFYNKGNAAFYYNGEGLIDHAITIVGWDDTYSKNNFNTRPTNDGAWIVKNSWGTEWGKMDIFMYLMKIHK